MVTLAWIIALIVAFFVGVIVGAIALSDDRPPPVERYKRWGIGEW